MFYLLAVIASLTSLGFCSACLIKSEICLLGGLGNVTILGGWRDAALTVFVKNQHSGATLKTGVPSLTVPVSITGSSQRHISIGVILAEWMFLTTSNILRPVACMGFFIVKKSSYTELFCGCTVPTGPVPGA